MPVRGRVTAYMTASATSSERSIPGRSGSSGVRPRPIAKAVSTPPGARIEQRTPRRKSSWSSERMKPIWACFDAA